MEAVHGASRLADHVFLQAKSAWDNSRNKKNCSGKNRTAALDFILGFCFPPLKVLWEAIFFSDIWSSFSEKIQADEKEFEIKPDEDDDCDGDETSSEGSDHKSDI